MFFLGGGGGSDYIACRTMSTFTKHVTQASVGLVKPTLLLSGGIFRRIFYFRIAGYIKITLCRCVCVD